MRDEAFPRENERRGGDAAALDRELAILRAAERLGITALRWLPYPDECPDHLLAEREVDDALISHDLDLIRRALKNAEFKTLVAAQERGEAHA